MSMFASLQGEEAVSNVIKLALILEDGFLWSWAVYGSMASELSFWQGQEPSQQKHFNTNDKHKVIKGCHCEVVVWW